MYDLKPDAPTEYRGDFKPIRTRVPGLEVCELLPLHARSADKFALIRSISHTFPGHGDGMKHVLTGREPGNPGDFITIHPMVGSMVAKCREKVRRGVPNYIAVTDPGRQGLDVYGFGSAYLGPSTHPFIFAGDPSDPKFQVPNLTVSPQSASRLSERLALLRDLDRPPAARDSANLMTGMDVSRARAVDLLQNAIARKAFDITREPARLRERYGMHAWGQRFLLARRLVEHGASFVTMVLENPYQSGLPAAADRAPDGNPDRREAAGPRPLAAGDVGADRRRRPQGRPGRRLNHGEGGASQGSAADAQRPVGDDVPAPGHRLRQYLLPGPPGPADAGASFRQADQRAGVGEGGGTGGAGPRAPSTRGR
jgi:hypothetical protein